MHQLFDWIRFSGARQEEKDEMTLCKGILFMFVILGILAVCVYIAA